MVIPLQKVTATQAIVENLKERIRSTEFGPGTRLPSEQALLKEYAVSRLTLREALARLAAVGIIHVRHGKGAYVNSKISISALDNVLIPLFPRQDLRRMNFTFPFSAGITVIRTDNLWNDLGPLNVLIDHRFELP